MERRRAGVDYSNGMSTVSQTSTRSTLNQKVAVVTGASRGIGLSIAEALLAAGASVVITGRDQAQLDHARSRLGEDTGAPVTAVSGSVTTPADASRMLQAAVDRFGGLDVLVNNAGVGIFNSVAAMSTEEWDSVIGTNLTGVFHCCHAAIPHLLRRGGGCDRQHQQPFRNKPVQRRCRVLRVEGRTQRFLRVADAGGTTRQHSRQLHHAGFGFDRVRRTRTGG